MSVSLDSVGTSVLHALRIKRLAAAGDIADMLDLSLSAVGDSLATLQTAGLVQAVGKNADRWHLSELGTEQHADLLAIVQAQDSIRDVRLGYEVFLEHNAPLKELMSDWQGQDQEPGGLILLLEEISETHAAASHGLEAAARTAPRFAAYEKRLRRALERARTGDIRYVADPVLPSYHTIWFECHEDFLVTLGRTRAQEGGV